FAAEFPMEGMVYASLAYSTVARGRIATLDTSEAEAAPGVVLVMTHRNAPRMNAVPGFGTSPLAAGANGLPILQDDLVHWNGQPIALVLAGTQEQASHASSLIRATYETEPAVTSFDDAKRHARQAQPFLGREPETKVGDAEAALAVAPFKVDAIYRTPPHNHNAIEPHAVTLAWDGDVLIVHGAEQGVVHLAGTLAEVFGLTPEQVHVTSPYVGGGFGAKGVWDHQVLAAAAAKLTGRPVRLALPREGVYRIVGGRAATEQRVAIGARPDGRFDAVIHTGVSAIARHAQLPEAFTAGTPTLYQAGSFELGLRVADVDMVANTFMRAPGAAVGSFALESAIDELAERLGMDPIELRIRNEPEKDPVSGREFSSRHLVEACRAGAERFGWDRRSATPGARREGEWLVGMGFAATTFPYVRFPGGAARITLSRDGHATIEVAAHEMGMGTATAGTQVAAARLGLPLDRVTFVYGASNLPGLVMAGGSQQTASIGASVAAAQRALVTELLEFAGEDSPLAGLGLDEIGCRAAGLCKLDEPDRYESYAAILGRAQRDEVTAEASAPAELEWMRWSMHSYGALFCEVRVSAVTGEPRVTRFLGSYDCGRILNAKTAASQLRGGIIMGLGLALMEETELDDRTGRIMNPSLSEYHIPVHLDVPEIDVMWTDIPDPRAPMGAHGIGEIGITGVGAAVANAIHNATGKRVRDLPITLDKIL
ncbi:MAG TPA: xanthine dehydrogenase family protein molybdopterin-binding subunit, partial [Candidatus Dormibacteraeota bacterium]